MRHTLVIAGSLHENVDLVEKAKARGYRTIVCDGYKEGTAKRIADKSYDISIYDVDAFSKMCIDEKADGIIGSFSDQVFEQVTKIATKAGLKWYATPDMLKYYRDKSEQKDLLARVGVCVPKHRIISQENRDSFSDFSFPVVIKPLHGWGSRNIRVCNTKEELDTYLSGLTGGEFEIEEYCDSHEYNCISWVIDGEVNILGIADRDRNPRRSDNVGYLNRVLYPSTKYDELYAPVKETLSRFAHATGQKSGPLSMQCFYKDGKVVVCEIAGRVLAHEHQLINYCGGCDIDELLLDYPYRSDEEIKKSIHSMDFKSCACSLYFLCERDKIVYDRSEAEKLLSSDFVERVMYFCDEGETFDSSRPYFARVYLKGKTKEELDRKTKYLFDNMKVRDKDGNNIAIPFYLEERN